MTRLEAVLKNCLRDGKLHFAESVTILAAVSLLHDTLVDNPTHHVVTSYGTQIHGGIASLNEPISVSFARCLE